MSTRLYELVSKRQWMELKHALQSGKVTLEEINYRDLDGFAVIHMVCGSPGPVDVVRLLLEKGAKLNAVNKDRLTPLHEAVRSNGPVDKALDVVRLLLEKGADVDARSGEQWTPLHFACREKASVEVIRLLLEEGADVNALEEDRWTPLNWACYEQVPVEVVRLLLDSGADSSLKNKYGETPLDYEERTEVQTLMKNHTGGTSLKKKPVPVLSTSAVSAASSASSSALPPFFLDLFAKASITDPTEQHDYAQKLLSKDIDPPAALLALSRDDLKKLGISLDVIRLQDAGNKVNDTL